MGNPNNPNDKSASAFEYLESSSLVDMATMAEDIHVTDLRAEIERLSRELDLASTERIQSAQYGLALLEEKSGLEHKCNELETLYENTKHELDITREVI